MLGRQIAITRIRGQRFPLDGRVLIPTLHPAAVLRSGGKQLEDLRADFEEMRKALEEPRAPRSVGPEAAPGEPDDLGATDAAGTADTPAATDVATPPEPSDSQLELF